MSMMIILGRKLDCL